MIKDHSVTFKAHAAIQAAINKALEGPGVTEVEIPFPIQFQPGTMLKPGTWEIGLGVMMRKEAK